MILFYSPGACSLAVHIALIEAEMSYRLVSVTRDKQTSDGRDFLAINPRGFVPTLELDDETGLAEALAILVYVAHQTGRLLPENGPVRWQALEATSFMTTEIHGNFKPFWRNAPEPEKENARQMLLKHFEILATQLGDKRYFTGDQMTIADPYLFVMLLWASMQGIKVSKAFEPYFARMKALPSVARALAEEGLV